MNGSRTGPKTGAAVFLYRIIPNMPRSDLFLKIQIVHDPEEKPQELAEEICRRLLKLHGVRSAELSSYLTHPDPDAAGSS